MGKYEPLTRYLESLDDDSWDADFETVERVLGFKLPDSAYQYQAWWANQTDGGHSQTRGWQEAGFETKNLDLRRKRIRFERVERSANRTASRTAAKRPPAKLWEEARKFSGISDQDELMEAALTALIQREAGRLLIELGGTMPDLVVPERERPTW